MTSCLSPQSIILYASYFLPQSVILYASCFSSLFIIFRFQLQAVAAVSLPDLPFNELKEASQNLEITAGPSESFSIQLEAEPDSSGKLELSADSNLRVSLKKVWETDELVFTVFLTNQSQNNTPISDVTSIFEPPSNLLATFDAGSSNKLHDAGIESSKTVSMSYDLLCGIQMSAPIL